MNISDYIQSGHSVFMSGIGGVSMSALAMLLHRRGVSVRGSDQSESVAVERLRDVGITVYIGHAAENLGECECVIRTAAVHDDNSEIMAARAAGTPVFERADAWGAVMDEHKAALCISGTHGKTTTTSMAVKIALTAGADVTAMIGGDLPGMGERGDTASHRVGSGDLIIAEACEYCNSFLRFRPTVAAILNIEADHLDFFSGLDDILASFREFASLVPDGGAVVVNADDQNAMNAVSGLENITTFGVENAADVRAVNLVCDHGCYSFDISHGGGLIPVKLSVPGRHNVSNAVCAAACMLQLGFGGVEIGRGLAAFGGAGRRFEYKGEFNGAKLYDDYAHHPTELNALFGAAAECGYERVLCVFQPHTYTRTKMFFGEFADMLQKPDLCCLLPVYAAREPIDPEVSSEMLAEKCGAEYAEDIEAAAEWVRKNARAGDLVLTVGAGVAYKVCDLLV